MLCPRVGPRGDALAPGARGPQIGLCSSILCAQIGLCSEVCARWRCVALSSTQDACCGVRCRYSASSVVGFRARPARAQCLHGISARIVRWVGYAESLEVRLSGAASQTNAIRLAPPAGRRGPCAVVGGARNRRRTNRLRRARAAAGRAAAHAGTVAHRRRLRFTGRHKSHKRTGVVRAYFP
jgi:hypothetical protein